ncbi:hypothetical protein DFQ27_006581 [Actinomortierella ambigua]|uniref:Uncharacterized protein n=1 Tax=Actinomortierella ambigua TaxID=1343610 RepID=A0A9P6PY13_9FUNG|nr:hypothetical protein DFQ27_006581 [Actinomortierella ambigua]
MPPLKGPYSTVADYLEHWSKYNQQLDGFYNKGFRFKKHIWDVSRAKQEEYNKIANALLKAAGGNIGTKRAENNPVIIVAGLSKFQTKAGLSVWNVQPHHLPTPTLSPLQRGGSNVGAAQGSSTASSTARSRRRRPSGGAKSDAKRKKSKMDHATESKIQSWM